MREVESPSTGCAIEGPGRLQNGADGPKPITINDHPSTYPKSGAALLDALAREVEAADAAVRLAAARAYTASGLSLIPIGAKSKAPPIKWDTYQSRRPNDAELQEWIGKYPGLGIVAGKVSGNGSGAALEILDLESIAPLDEFRKLVDLVAPGLLDRLPCVATPTGGQHIYYRCAVIAGNQKLAQKAEIVADADLPRADDGSLDEAAIKRMGLRDINGRYCRVRTLIETRGEGGQALSPLCLPGTHPSGGVYTLISGDLTAIPTITTAERDILLNAARACNEMINPKKIKGAIIPKAPAGAGLKPGEDFNARPGAFEQSQSLLEKAGWTRFREDSLGLLLSRPGVTDHCSARLFSDGALYIFSSNAAPFSINEAYSPFAIFAELEHNGDYSAAAKALAKQGYGDEKRARNKQQIQSDQSAKQATGESVAVHTEQSECPYRANGVGLVWMKRVFDREAKDWKDVDVPLTNFTAEITGDVSRDDGAEQTRVFEIVAKLAGEAAQHKGAVKASEFDSLRWTSETLGARAVIFPGKKEHTATAIRLLSRNIKMRRVVAHTGWRFDEGRALYYHAGGAIGAEGLIAAEVDLPPQLQLCNLPQQPEGERLTKVVRAIAFDLTKVAAEAITLPLVGCGFAAVVSEPDFSGFLVGPTGGGKSELVSLIQAFFGSGFNAKSLPGSWSSSANSLEALAHTAKDCVFVVDDFCPTGSTQEQARLHAAADRVHRAQGNHSGRMRCRADGCVRPPKPPRGLSISTGEDLPRGHSLRARLAVIQVGKDAVNWDQLTTCQAQAREGFYAAAMSAFLRWLAADNRIVKLRSQTSDDIGKLREEWLSSGVNAHKRSATMLAYLQRAWNIWLEFATDCAALDGDEITGLREAVKISLDGLGHAQEGYHASENPALRFIELIQAAIVSGKAHLTTTDNERPDKCESWGWRVTGPDNEYRALGDRIGWIEGADVYLHPDAAYRCAQSIGTNGEGVTVTARTLWKRLREAGFLASCESDERLTIKKQIGDSRPRVLHFCAKIFTGSI